MKRGLVLFFLFVLTLSACATETHYRQVRAIHAGSPEVTPETTPTITGAPPTPSTSDPLREKLKQYLQNPPSSKVTYALQSTIQDKEGTHTLTGTQLLVIRGKDLRIQTQSQVNDQTLTAANYVLHGQYYACQMEKNQWTCYEFPKPPQDPTPQIQQAIQEDLEKLDITDGGTQTLLNTPTHCYNLHYEESDKKGQTTYCYEEQGILLYSHTQTDTFESSLTAQSYSSDVRDSEFTLPAAPKPIQETSTDTNSAS